MPFNEIPPRMTYDSAVGWRRVENPGPAYDWTGAALQIDNAITCDAPDCEINIMRDGRQVREPRVYNPDREEHRHMCCPCGICYCVYSTDAHECNHLADNYDEPSNIFNYGYKPAPIFFGGAAPFHVGIELEITASRRASATPIYEWAEQNGSAGLFYAKEDGSVAGFEIVSHPMTPEFFRNFRWLSFFRMLNSRYPMPDGGRVEAEGHGLHVHVSRTAFPTASMAARWGYLLTKNYDRVSRIARRESTEWAAPSEHPVLDALAGAIRADAERWSTAVNRTDRWGGRPATVRRHSVLGTNKPLRDHSLDRYLLCNHLPNETIEIRCFRSTRRASEFKASVGLVIDSVEFVRDLHARREALNALTWQAFTAYRNAKTSVAVSAA